MAAQLFRDRFDLSGRAVPVRSPFEAPSAPGFRSRFSDHTQVWSAHTADICVSTLIGIERSTRSSRRKRMHIASYMA